MNSNMRHRDPNRMADRIIFWVCLFALIGLCIEAGYRYGYRQGIAVPRVCASVPGQQVVSSTADSCTYASDFGRATKRRKAI